MLVRDTRVRDTPFEDTVSVQVVRRVRDTPFEDTVSVQVVRRVVSI
jgi:hypothetical protein